MFFQEKYERMSRADMSRLQLDKLRHIVDYCIANVPFYAERLSAAGVCGSRIKSLDDIKHIPFTTKEDLRDNYPFGLFGAPMKDIVRIHASSGTTGKPTVVGYTKNDLNMWSDCVARLLVSAGVSDEDIVQISFGYGLFTGALGLHYGLEKIGAAIIPASSGNSEKQIMLMNDFGVTGLVSTPTYAMYLSEFVKENNLDTGNFRLKHGIFGSESCSVEMRAKIEENFNLFATDNYGMSELMGPGLSGECRERDGLHICEDHFYGEIINSDTGESLPEGSVGEAVFTTLTREGFPMLRYRTKDISRFNYDICKCGRTAVRMDKIKGRTDDMLKIKGVNVFPSQIESVLLGQAHIGNHYQLVVTRDGYLDNLEIRVELIDGSLLESYKELENLQRNIQGKLRSVLGLDAKVSLVQPQTLERFQGKAKRVLDLRGEKNI
ncbi:MAG: phenylacetate--CoA ligase [Oscillospiraceae bacterium]|nr:phenylacetate--CoA ligase [Oscillospiraceae bacterium]